MKTKGERVETIIREAIEINPYFNRSKLADVLNISRNSLYRVMDKIETTKQLS